MMHDKTIDTLRRLGEHVAGSHAERLALLVIVAESMPITHVADRVGMSRGAMTTIADRLVAQKLVKRVHGSVDRRMVLLKATPRGVRAVEAASA